MTEERASAGAEREAVRPEDPSGAAPAGGDGDDRGPDQADGGDRIPGETLADVDHTGPEPGANRVLQRGTGTTERVSGDE